jgi:hypothetical protein
MPPSPAERVPCQPFGAERVPISPGGRGALPQDTRQADPRTPSGPDKPQTGPRAIRPLWCLLHNRIRRSDACGLIGGSANGALNRRCRHVRSYQLLRIDRMDLIEAHPASFVTTDHIAAEIADASPDQQTAMRSPSIPAKSPNNASTIQRK